jgi:putative FmdB family regulatory protein
MPIREYECKDCQLKFETIELSGDSEKVTCPRCHSENVERKLSLFSNSPGGGASCNFTRGFG